MRQGNHSTHLHLGSSSQTYERAKSLRQNLTDAEELLWSLLRNRKLHGCKFRRQHPLANYIADFYCHEKKLVIELDGQHHKKQDAKTHDETRSKFFREHGIKVVRFWNAEVMNETGKVLDRIAAYLQNDTQP